MIFKFFNKKQFCYHDNDRGGVVYDRRAEKDD